MQTKERKELLTALADSVGCNYLSDLPRLSRQPCLCQAVCRTSAEDYPLQEWNDAVEYIAQQGAAFETPQQAREFLIQRLSANTGAKRPSC